MAPLRALLGSRAVIAGLAALGCLTLFISTMDSSSRPRVNWGNNHQVVHNNADSQNSQCNNVIQWDDAMSPARDLGKPLTEYPRRNPRTVQHMIEKTKGYYDRIVRQRHQLLAQNKFGTP